jgi:hypothetical protein
VKHRRHRRVEARGVAVHIDADADCNIENISVGGLFLRTTSPLPIGMPVRVDLAKAGQRTPLVVSGRVVSVVTQADSARTDSPPGVGIELDPMTPDTEKRYYSLLRELGLKDLADPTPIEPDDLRGNASPDTHMVASNVRGLLDMLTDALQKVKERDDEILKLKAEIRRLTVELKKR